jgi:predicted RNase H-like HicB family nuclease
MQMTLTAVYEQVSKSDGDGYVAYVEELPGAISAGDTLEEARENLRKQLNKCQSEHMVDRLNPQPA